MQAKKNPLSAVKPNSGLGGEGKAQQLQDAAFSLTSEWQPSTLGKNQGLFKSADFAFVARVQVTINLFLQITG